MIIIKTLPSWNKETNKDIFNNEGPTGSDYVHPLSKGGSPTIDNMQILSMVSNDEKLNKKKGIINNVRFSFQSYLDKNQYFVGTMYIQNEECDPLKDEWIRVTKVKEL